VGVKVTDKAAQTSREWFENSRRYLKQHPLQFTFNLMTRSKRITYDNLRKRDPELVRRVTEWFADETGMTAIGAPVNGASAVWVGASGDATTRAASPTWRSARRRRLVSRICANVRFVLRDAAPTLEMSRMLQVEPPASVRGHAHYLLRLNEPLKRSVTARWARGRSQWTPYDGITRVTGMTKSMLDSQRLGARPYSLSALQKYAVRTGGGANHRLFCLLERNANDLGGPSLICLDGLSKPVRSAASPRDYRRVLINRRLASRVMFVPGVFRRYDYAAMMNRILPGLEIAPRVVVLRADVGHFERFEQLLEESSALEAPLAIDDIFLKLATNPNVLAVCEALLYASRAGLDVPSVVTDSARNVAP
jgi:hypothetical protein